MSSIANKASRRSLVIVAVLAFAALLFGRVGPSQAGAGSDRSQTTRAYRDSDQHIAQNANIDGDDVGFTAIAGTGSGRSNLGPIDHSWITEVASEPVELEECADDSVLGLRFIYNSSVRTFRHGHELHAIHDPGNPGYICFFPDGTAEATIHQLVVGGTGRYEGATGELTATLTTRNLLPTELEGVAGEFWGPGSWTTTGTVTFAGR